MDSSAIADTAVRMHLQDNPETERASFRDAVLHSEIYRVRQFLDLTAAALAAEGIDLDTIRRITARLAADAIGTDDDRRRRDQEMALITSALKDPFPQAWSTGAATPEG